MDAQQFIVLLIALAAMIAFLLLFVLFLLLGRVWIKAFMSGAPVSVFALLGMLSRGTPRSLAVEAYIQLIHRGSPATIQDVERQYLANPRRVRNANDLADLVEMNFASDSDAQRQQ